MEYKLVVEGDQVQSLEQIHIPPPPKKLLDMRGCNLVGGATYYKNWDGGVAPVYGKHYRFCSFAEVDEAVAQGMNTFRVLFSWEAMTLTPSASIGGTYSSKLYELVDYITMVKRCNVVLDIHGDKDTNFAAFKDVTVAVTSVANGFVNLWGQLATKFKYNDRVMYGLANEPHNITAPVWFAVAQRAINAIRATGARQTIIVPGTNWTGAATWLMYNASYWNLTDPLNNLQFQVHLYLDADASGRTETIVDANIGIDRVRVAVLWARAKGVRMYLAEVAAAASNPIAAECTKRLFDYLVENSDVVSGFAWWARGPNGWWDNYRFSLHGANGPSPQMALIADYLK